VTRTFEPQDQTTTISEADTGREITNTFERGKLGRVHFAREHFGMSEEVFINTCFVRQADLHHLADAAQEITETVVNLSGTGRQDRSVMHALAILDGALNEQVGTARSRKKPLPLALERREQLAQERQAILAVRQAMEADYTRRGDILRTQEQATHELHWLQCSRVAYLRDQFAAQLGKLGTLMRRRDELAKRLLEAGNVNEAALGQRDIVLRLNQAWQHRHEEAERVGATLGGSNTTVSTLRTKRQAVAEQQLQHEVARSVPVEHEAAMRELERLWRDSRAAFEPIDTAHREIRERLGQMQSRRDPSAASADAIQQEVRQIQSLRIRWEAAAHEVATAEQDHQIAAAACQGLALSEADYAELHTRLAGLTFDDLRALKAGPAAADPTQRSQRRGVRWLGWFLLAAGLIALIAGALASLGGIGNGLPPLMIGGVFGVLLGLASSGVGIVLLLRRISAPKSGPQPDVSRPNDLRGFATVAELETAYQRFLRAQSPFETLARARVSLATHQAELLRVESEVRALLRLSPELPVGLSVLVDAHQAAQAREARLKELADLESQAGRTEERLRAAQDQIAHREAPLKQALQALSMDTSDLAQGLRRYYDLCARRREWDRLAAELRSFDAELKLHLSREGDANTTLLAEAEARRQLMAVLAQLGFGGDDPRTAIEAFEAACEQAALAQGLGRDLEAMDREIQAGLAGRALQDIQQQHETLAREADSLQATLPDHHRPPERLAVEILEHRIEELRSGLAQSGIELAAVEQRLVLGSAGQRSLAEVDEEILSNRASITALELHGQALELATSQMRAAADEHHRNFLPQLNQIVGKNLGQVTGGRYPNVQIDHANLQIRLQVPGNPTPVTPDILSRGAQELIYLLLRLGLTQLMSNGHERLPLVLDDPLVNYDQARLNRGLELLADMAMHTQVLLFTKDLTTAEWTRARIGSGHRLLEL
jgi:hypothetical protein